MSRSWSQAAHTELLRPRLRLGEDRSLPSAVFSVIGGENEKNPQDTNTANVKSCSRSSVSVGHEALQGHFIRQTQVTQAKAERTRLEVPGPQTGATFMELTQLSFPLNIP